MQTTLVDRPPWIVSEAERPPALEIVLLKQTVVLSWNQFVYAEGDDGEIRIAFASHDVIVRGAGLIALLQAITAHRVNSIREPARSDSFPGQWARFIREIEVRRIDVD